MTSRQSISVKRAAPIIGRGCRGRPGQVERGPGRRRCRTGRPGPVRPRRAGRSGSRGRLIGSPGSSKAIRLIQGGPAEAWTLFRQLVRETGATPISDPRFPGTLVELPGRGGKIGFGAISQSGPPTIEVFIPGLGIREIKFTPQVRK